MTCRIRRVPPFTTTRVTALHLEVRLAIVARPLSIAICHVGGVAAYCDDIDGFGTSIAHCNVTSMAWRHIATTSPVLAHPHISTRMASRRSDESREPIMTISPFVADTPSPSPPSSPRARAAWHTHTARALALFDPTDRSIYIEARLLLEMACHIRMTSLNN